MPRWMIDRCRRAARCRASCWTTGTIVFICRLTWASTKMPLAVQLVRGAEHHRVADGDDRRRGRRRRRSSAAPSSAATVVGTGVGTGRVAGRRRPSGRRSSRRRVSVVGRRVAWSPCRSTPAELGQRVGAALVSASDWAISFGLSSAVARLATANTESGHDGRRRSRRSPGAAPDPRAGCSRRHHRPTWALRIGISMKRYETSVIDDRDGQRRR